MTMTNEQFEKEMLEIEKLKQDIALDMKRFDVELSKKGYEAWRVAMYGIAVGLGGTFAIAKTISLLGWVG
ncbi:MAG: hypothetical protein DRG11_03645 [Epsilonproteobacteria bacterium]|nr:MAG: hypothetical protein DRG11_03645 [Campylobacterota bacterium]